MSSTTNSSLCSACQRVFSTAAFPPIHSTENEHHRTAADCRLASQAGCFICHLVWTRITDFGNQQSIKWNSSKSFTRYELSQSSDTLPYGLEAIETQGGLWWPGKGTMPPGSFPEPSGQWLLTVTFHNVGEMAQVNFAELAENYEAIFVLQPVENAGDLASHNVESDSTDSEESWGWVLRWLSACVSSHDKCSTPYNQNDNRYYPSRLIEIGEAVDDLVYLQERDGASFSGDYIALSHCWGKTPMTKLVSTQEEAPKAEFLVPLTTDRSETSSDSKSSGPKEDEDTRIPQVESESHESSNPGLSTTSNDNNLTDSTENQVIGLSPEESQADGFSSTTGSDNVSLGSTEGQDLRISREKFLAGFPSSELPKTFQDAIVVVRRLRIKYLWIDSLCILQDSPEDWKHESAQMHHVYGNAYVTLAADDSRNSREGLFRVRPPFFVTPTIVTASWKEALSKEFVIIPRRFWNESVAESPLNQRAWVLQERYLSPRTIHFGESQILWECRSLDCCETFPHGIPEVAQDIHTRFKGNDFDVDGLRLRQANLEDDQMSSDSEEDELIDSATDSTSSATDLDELYHSDNDDTAGASAEHEDRDRRSNALVQAHGQVDKTSAGQIAHGKAQGGREEGSSAHARRKRNSRSLNGYYVWSRLLEKYSKTAITFLADRLVALSGIAQIMSEALEDNYLAGLWESILPSQLLWRVGQFTPRQILDFGKEPNPTLHNRANPTGHHISCTPSWSWASVDGAISTSRPSRKGSLVHIMPLSFGYGGSTIDPAVLLITGDLHVARLSYTPNVNRWMLFIDKRGKRVFERPCGSGAGNARFVPDGNKHHEEKDYKGIAAAYPDSMPPKDSQQMFCIPIMRRKRTRALQREEYGNETISGLMVLPKRHGPFCRWRRVGCFDTLPDEAKVDWGEEYCYSEDNKMLFTEGPRGLDDTVIWLF